MALTERDKRWLDERFNGVKGRLDGLDQTVYGPNRDDGLVRTAVEHAAKIEKLSLSIAGFSATRTIATIVLGAAATGVCLVLVRILLHS